MYVGIDDTDSLTGQCTTYLLTEIIRILIKEFDIIGYPRLVRLNPNIPWKTRGNAALSVRFGYGYGKKIYIGKIGDTDVYSYIYEQKKSPSKNEMEKIFSECTELVEKQSILTDEKTNPGLVILEKKPPEKLYWTAVRDIVYIDDVKKILNESAGYYKGFKNERGLIGATASIAWRPKKRTYELITYRRGRLKKRIIDEESVIKMDRTFKETFNNYDYLQKRVCIAPHTPCPILFGIRATSPNRLIDAMNSIKSEKPVRWFIYETNQGTDDHIVSSQRLTVNGQQDHVQRATTHHPLPTTHDLRPWTSVKFTGYIFDYPRVIKGGHVIITVTGPFHGSRATIDCIAYEPSKTLPKIVSQLIPNDKITVYGSVRDQPRTINIEKLQILTLAEHRVKVENPFCRKCDKHTKSLGKNKGFRCIKCGTKFSIDEAKYITKKRKIAPGWYEPTTSSLRHIAMPLRIYEIRDTKYE